MADLHIDEFLKDAGLILLHLYSSFPRRQLLYVEDIAGPVEFDEFGLPGNRYQACFSTMLWLAEEGWLRYDTTLRQEAIDQAVLTQQGFLLLSSVTDGPAEPAASDLPSSLAAAARTHLFAIRRALTAGSTVAINRSVRALLAAAPATR